MVELARDRLPSDGGGPGGRPAGLDARPLRILGQRRLAAGNRLGRRPCLVVAIETAPGAACDADAVRDLLARLAPDIADEFDLVRVAGPEAPLPRAFARTMAALTAVGRDLAVRVEGRLQGPRPVWRILVEDGLVIRAEAVVDLAADLLAHAVAADRPADPVLRSRLEAVCGTEADRFGRGERAFLARTLEARGCAWRRDGEAAIGAVGEGWRRVRMRQGTSMRTMWPGAVMAERKDTTRDRLARAGLPVPRQIAVADAAAACAAAATIGYPVVVKPIDCSNARGVTVGNRTPEAAAAAFALARGFSRDIVVESELPGDAFRLLVLDGRVAATVLSAPGRVVGDGVRTLRDLVEAANAIPKRRWPRPLQRRISFTAEILEYLAERGLGPDSVPAAGRVVALHWSGHGARGGSPVAVAGPIHPDNAAAAIQAARVIGLDIAGIDMVVPDIASSWRDTGGGICEVNRAPGFRYHLVADGAESPVLDRYLDHLLARPGLPAAGPPTIPILLFLGGRDLDQAALAAAGLLECRGLGVGLATSGRYSAAGLPLADPGPGSPRRLARLVDDPAVQAIVAVIPPATVLEHGLGHARADLVFAADAAPAGMATAAGVIEGLGAVPMPVAAVTDGRLRRWVEARCPAIA